MILYSYRIEKLKYERYRSEEFFISCDSDGNSIRL